jgi:hypothetical protein
MRRSLLSLLMLLLLVGSVSPKGVGFSNPYPNELPGFKFYGKYLAPLRPHVSTLATVVHVLGSDQGKETSGWKIRPFFVGKSTSVDGRTGTNDVTGRLAHVQITPKEPISMLRVKFPAAFTHSVGGVSEINVSCDVYSDSFGLEYWLYANDSATRKKGDLMRIIYGPSGRVEGM